MTSNGIVYALTGEHVRGVVVGYHQKASPNHLGFGAKSSDIKNLKKKDKINVLKMTSPDDEFFSKFTIGFEIEKNQFHRSAVKEYELFCGFERDGSCGYEAVTHILPLVGDSTWKTKVFDMMWKARKIIDDTHSPSDKKCGGHITIAVEGLSGKDLLVRIRKFCGILYAIYKGRLKNSYCNANNRLLLHHEYQELYHRYGCGHNEVTAMHDSWRRRNGRYEVAIFKDACDDLGCPIEFRLPSRVSSVNILMRRYELFYELVNAAANTPDMKFSSFLRKVRPIVMSMYDGDSSRVAEVMKLAVSFQHYIDTGMSDERINQFLP